MNEQYLKIGSYTPETDETEAIIERDYFQQGWIVKDEEAFLHYPDKVCYVPAGLSGYDGRAGGICHHAF